MYVRALAASLAFCMTFLQGIALARSDGPDGRNRPHGPPREALEACNGKQPGDTVMFKNREGRQVNATCRLIAVPEHAPATK